MQHDNNTTSAIGAPLQFNVEKLTSYSAFELTLTAEIITTKTGNKLVLFLPSEVSRKLVEPVPYSLRDLDYLSLPSKPIIVLGDSTTADYSSYAGTQFQCSIGNAECWENDYVIYYRASVTSADIEAFNQQNGTTPTTGQLWEELGKNNVLMGANVKESPSPLSKIFNLLGKIKPEHVIMCFASLGAVYTAYAAFLAIQSGFIGTALIHVPLALFGLYAAFSTLKIDKRFSVLATAFVLLNAVVV